MVVGGSGGIGDLGGGVGGFGGLGAGIGGIYGDLDGPSVATGKNEAEKSYEKRGEEGYIKAGEENESEEEEKDKKDDNDSLMGREIRSKSQHEVVKTISIDRFQVVMPIDDPAKVTGDLVLKCQLEKSFDEFRNIMKNENIDGPFKKSCIGHILRLATDYMPVSK
ncbi:hypothetical protein FXO38_07550 [Capsicum annuum]|nr:hypothetical protein FXO37_16700 [Capsicum annuum]KAF3669523.1 hypothetical protein FXO38_07550 [Capsicum annuum]